MNVKKFLGTTSGDCECFCFDVDRKTFVDITGREPEHCDDFQAGEYVYGMGLDAVFVPKDENKCRLYPNAVFGPGGKKLEIEIKIKEL